MIFHPPSWLPAIPQELASAGPVGDFVLHKLPGTASEQKALVSAITQKGKTHQELAEDVEALAAGLAHDLEWAPNEPAQGGKVIAVLSENTVNIMDPGPRWKECPSDGYMEGRLPHVHLGYTPSWRYQSPSPCQHLAGRKCEAPEA